jgi:hypothetical protein
MRYFSSISMMRNEVSLLALAAIGFFVYAAAVWALLGRAWLAGFAAAAPRSIAPPSQGNGNS